MSLSLILVPMLLGIVPGRCFAEPSSPGMGPFREVQRIRLPAPPYSVAWSPDGRRLAVLDPLYLRVYSTEEWKQIFFRAVLHRLYVGKSLAFTSDDTVLVGGSGESGDNRPDNAHTITMQTIGEDPRQVFIPENREGRSFLPQDRFALSLPSGRVAASDVSGRMVYIYGLIDRSLRQTVAAQSVNSPLPAYMQSSNAPSIITDAYSALAMSPDGETIAACTLFGNV